MFVRGQLQAAVSFAVAQARLEELARGDGLLRAAYEAYGQGISGLAQDDPPGLVGGTSRLADARFGDLVADRDRAHMALRWEAIAADGALFPVLDADLALTPAGERATTLDLAGVYRPPPGTERNGLDPSGLQRVAPAIIQAFLNRIAAAIGSNPSAGGTAARQIKTGPCPPLPRRRRHYLVPARRITLSGLAARVLAGRPGVVRRTRGRGSRESCHPGPAVHRRSAAPLPRAAGRSPPAGSRRYP